MGKLNATYNINYYANASNEKRRTTDNGVYASTSSRLKSCYRLLAVSKKSTLALVGCLPVLGLALDGAIPDLSAGSTVLELHPGEARGDGTRALPAHSAHEHAVAMVLFSMTTIRCLFIFLHGFRINSPHVEKVTNVILFRSFYQRRHRLTLLQITEVLQRHHEQGIGMAIVPAVHEHMFARVFFPLKHRVHGVVVHPRVEVPVQGHRGFEHHENLEVSLVHGIYEELAES